MHTTQHKTLYELERAAVSEFEPVEGTRFRKELIRTGTWKNAQADFSIDVTAEVMNTWIETFHRMLADGIKVPVPFGHSYDSRDNAGFVAELEQDGESLYAILDIPKQEDRDKLGTTIQDVSISINPHFVGGNGIDYGEAIEHVALTNYPVVPSQSNFQQIFANDNERIDFITLTPDGGVDCEENPAPALLENIKKLLHLEGDDSNESVLQMAAEKIEHYESDIESMRAQMAETHQQSQTEEENQKEITDLKMQLEKIAGEQKSRDENEDEQFIKSLVSTGRITPAMALDARNILTASRDSALQLASDGQPPVRERFRAFLAALPENACIDLSEKTKHFDMPADSADGMTDEKATRIASENKKLIKR